MTLAANNNMDSMDLTSSQIEYYRARASEYDEWHMRLGRYDRGPDHRRQWFSEFDAVRTALDAMRPFGEVLELACGTGLWTAELAQGASAVTAVDAVSETIEINRWKNADTQVEYEVADIFDWKPAHRYDLVFFGFWLSHVPAERFEGFWDTVHSALMPSGRVFFVDSLQTQTSTARDHAMIDDSGIVERRLNDGSRYHIGKRFYDPGKLENHLNGLGWMGSIQTTGDFFFYGRMTRKSNGQQGHAAGARTSRADG